jgi:adenine deaminase
VQKMVSASPGNMKKSTAWLKIGWVSTLSAPFMTLSFMALLVIPELKLSDKGLFDGRAFQFIDVCRKPVRAIPGPVESP